MRIVAGPAVVVPHSAVGSKQDSDWLSSLILYLPLIGVTFVAKLAIVVGGSELIAGVPVILGTLLLGVLTGRLKPHPRRFALYMLVMAIMVGLSAFAAPAFVPSSLSLLLMMPLAAAFELRGAGVDSLRHQRRILDFTLFFCLLGIAQYLAQFVIGPRLAYPIDNFGPHGLISITKNYNALIPLRYGASTLKANGVFLLEPSYFSQTVAVGLVMEATGPRRWMRLLIYLSGFVVAYSGTGLLMLAPALPVLIVAERRYEILAYIAVLAVAMLVFSKPLGLEVFLDRATEFESTRSSGYARYVGGVYLFEQYLWPHPQRALFGMGSGMMFRSTPWPQFFVAETGWVKILIEFGLVGFIAYFGFLFFCIFSAKQSPTLRACIAVTPLLSGILDPWSHALMLGLLVWMPPRPAKSTFDHRAREPDLPVARTVVRSRPSRAPTTRGHAPPGRRLTS